MTNMFFKIWNNGMKRKALRAIFLIGAVAVLATGCRSARQAAKNETSEQPAAVVNQETAEPVETQVQKRQLTMQNFTATVDGVSVNGQLRMAEDSVIWVTVSKIIELGRAKATADSVWVNVPLAGRSFAGTYREASRLAKREVSFAQLQSIATASDAGQQIEALAATLGFEATVRLGRRQVVEQLAFPF